MVGSAGGPRYAAGIAAFDSILEAPCGLEYAIEHAPEMLRHCAEKVMRMVLVGRELAPA